MPIEESLTGRWSVPRTSLFGSLLPMLAITLGCIGVIVGLSNAAFPFASHSRVALLWLVSCGVFAVLIGSVPLALSVRTIELQPGGVVMFKSLMREFRIPGQKVMSITSLPPLWDFWRIYPVVITTTERRLLVARQLERGAELERVLLGLNPALTMRGSFSLS